MHTRMVHSRAAKRSRCTDVPVSWMYMHHIEIHDIVHYIHYILTVGTQVHIGSVQVPWYIKGYSYWL